MDTKKSTHYVILPVIVGGFIFVTLCILSIFSSIEARAAILNISKPVNKWYVCKDLGMGTVPGLSGTHYRIKLCHPKGWEILTYCTQPSLPPPLKNASCTRVSDQAYRCGSGYQRLHEYRILAQPPAQETETITPTLATTTTSTVTPTSTNTPSGTQIVATMTPVVARRPKPGGDANVEQLNLLLLFLKITILSTPLIALITYGLYYFDPLAKTISPTSIEQEQLPSNINHNKKFLGIGLIILLLLLLTWFSYHLIHLTNQVDSPAGFVLPSTSTPTHLPTSTAFIPAHPTGAPKPTNSTALNNPTITATIDSEPEFSGIDFGDQRQWVTIKIIPRNKSINGGKTFSIKFIPSDHCKFGTQRACINTYRKKDAAKVIFLTIHSGFGGEAEPFRRAIEGNGVNRVIFSLDQIHQNLSALEGSEVMIKQGEAWVKGFKLVATARIPPRKINKYFKTPIDGILTMAASFNPNLAQLELSNQSLIVFETCGWRIPSEAWSLGVSDTTGSVYLGVIQKLP